MHRLLSPDHLRTLARHWKWTVVGLSALFAIVYLPLGLAILGALGETRFETVRLAVGVPVYLVVGGLIANWFVRLAQYARMLRSAADWPGPYPLWNGSITAAGRTYFWGRAPSTRYRIALSGSIEVTATTIGVTGAVAPVGDPVTLQPYGTGRTLVAALRLDRSGVVIPVRLRQDTRPGAARPASSQ